MAGADDVKEIKNIREFAERMADAIRARKGAGHKVTISEHMRNNDTFLLGIEILPEGKKVAPTMLLEGKFAEYQKGKPFEQVVSEFLRDYDKVAPKVNQEFNIDFMDDFERVKDYIYFRVAGVKTNRKLLKEVPHKIFCKDLAIIFYVMVSDDPATGLHSLIIRHVNADKWAADDDTLLRLAMKNTPRLFKGVVYPAYQSFTFMQNREAYDRPTDKPYVIHANPLDMRTNMYTCTNFRTLNGAAVMLYDGLLADFAEAIGMDFYILPSSVHDLMFAPDRGDSNEAMLKHNVMEINKLMLDKEEFLSNSVYVYRRKTGRVEKCL